MNARAGLLLVIGCGLFAAAALGQTAPGGQSEPLEELETTPADSVMTLAERLAAIEVELTAMQDSLLALGRSPAIVEDHIGVVRTRMQREATEADLDARGVARPLFYNCENTPEGGINATVTKVNYYSKWSNSVKARDNGNVATNFGIALDSYRRQERTNETRNASVDYSSGQILPVILNAQARIDWSEDITTNTGGLTNVKASKNRRAGIGVSRNQLLSGIVSHNVTGGAYYNDRNAVNQGQRNDFREGELNGALRSGAPVAEGVNIATRVYGIWRDGQSNLAEFESPSSTTGDTLGVGAYYKRSLLTGSIVATQSAFDKRYLDYRRNSNGLIDTTRSNLPPGASTVVQELEEHDALDLSWDNTLAVGRVKLVSKLSHAFDRQQYSQSGVGRKDKAEDKVELLFTTPVGADSFAVAYKFNLKWNDQRIQGADSYTGRQNNKTREFTADWFREVFTRTTLSARYRTELYQDIAEVVDDRPVNENDRDRLTQEVRIKVDAAWTGRFTVSLLGEYQTIDDIAIRETRSANNNVKSTYEVAPSYRLDISPQLTLSQTFRMYIQYQDYDYLGYEGVNKEDGFNKRGNLGTSLGWEPSERLSVDLKHDYNQKFNGTRTRRDASGASFYRRDQDQTINRVEVGLSWKASKWLTLSSATYRTKDVVERFGTTNVEDARYSGELWVGGVVKHTWGSKDHPLVLDASIRRYLAYGPNVTDTSSDYWKADVLMKWTF